MNEMLKRINKNAYVYDKVSIEKFKFSQVSRITYFLIEALALTNLKINKQRSKVVFELFDV